MLVTANRFKEVAAGALHDPPLQEVLADLRVNAPAARNRAAGGLPEFETLRDAARTIKLHAIEHLDLYLERFESKVRDSGGQVHWCADGEAARKVILDICRAAGARTVTKGKTMVGEEIAINAHLESHGITPVETDLGEYIIQLRGEPPSHIIAPSIHVGKEQVAEIFREKHGGLDPNRPLDDIGDLLAEARGMLRRRFLAADVGITGANFLIAETGSTVIVTNEGNGDLTQTLPRVHIVLAGIEKIVPTLEDATTIMRVLARSATGQEMSVYTTFSTGPRRSGDPDGPEHFHVVLLDNGRSAMLGTEFQDLLRCIRCGACLDHCPVYHAVGGHAYGSTYSGPIGAELTPALVGLEKAANLPNASTLCGRCEAVCPMRIPLPKLLRRWRELEFERHLTPPRARWALKLWAFAAGRPALYRLTAVLTARLLYWLGGQHGRISNLPFAGGWTAFRDLPAPQGETFQARWRRQQRQP
ncbi:MAG: LutB/LldF family L-lactate oxidation iron-sulfur protein [Dongiaceae bacterium]